MTNKSNLNKILGWGAAIVIGLSIIGGFSVIGSPNTARMDRLDTLKTNNIRQTANLISCYSEAFGDLPEDITAVKAKADTAELKNGNLARCGRMVWKLDPETKLDFDYKRLGPNSFELCADFKRPKKAADRLPYQSRPAHNVLDGLYGPRSEAGQACFVAKNWSGAGD